MMVLEEDGSLKEYTENELIIKMKEMIQDNVPINHEEDEQHEESPLTNIKECLLHLSREAKELYLGQRVPERFQVPRPLDFYREWVSYNRPVIFRKAINHWPALQNWKQFSYLSEKLGNKKVTVSVTPNGYADSIVGDRFVMPCEETMTMSEFLRKIENPEDGKVYYIQKQNSNLTDEFAEIFDDIQELSWAEEAFGKDYDAVNFWMGDERAVTSCHKDPYENIYCVVHGHKDIILYPPSDTPWIPYQECIPAIYEYDVKQDKFSVTDLKEPHTISWISIDPLCPNFETHPEFRYATPYKLRLEAGDVLYMPSLWFHHLTQSQGCIAVNFWYDMEFDPKYNYFNLLSNLAKLK